MGLLRVVRILDADSRCNSSTLFLENFRAFGLPIALKLSSMPALLLKDLLFCGVVELVVVDTTGEEVLSVPAALGRRIIF